MSPAYQRGNVRLVTLYFFHQNAAFTSLEPTYLEPNDEFGKVTFSSSSNVFEGATEAARENGRLTKTSNSMLIILLILIL